MISRSPFETFEWHSQLFNRKSTDIDYFFGELEQQITRLKLNKKSLGNISKHELILLQSPSVKSGSPSILISAGFHGEEAAGPWGLLHFLSTLSVEIFEQVNLTLLPLANPTGFSKGHRFNKQGQNPNRGFLPEKDSDKLACSREGRLLLDHSQLLQAASRDGVLTCHEDILQNNTYIYSFEPRQQPGAFSFHLRDTLGLFFDIADDGDIDGCPMNDGVIFNHFDTSFEAWLVRSGAKLGVCSETPALEDFDQRIMANSAVMTAFVTKLIKDAGSEA